MRRFDPYRLSKVLAERAAWDLMGREGGATSFTTVLPGAVFGPVLSPDALGSANVIKGLLNGRPGAIPRLALWIVDVRDLADLHIKAMTAQQAAGQRFLATGEFMWMSDVAETLRRALGPRAAKVPTRRLPDLAFRLLALFNPQFRMLAQEVGRRNPVSSDKARRVLGFAPRPAAQTVIDCANSLL
jgi:nucleoside-diphosphate-sugar epimerase